MSVQTLAIIVLLASFFVMIFLRFPIAYAGWCRARRLPMSAV